MDFIDITADNLNDFLPAAEQWLKDDLRLGRFLGVAAMEAGESVGQLVYTIRRNEEGKGCYGALYYLSGDEAVMEALLEEYYERCLGFDVSRTLVETPLKETADFLARHGFEMEEGESIILTFPLEELEKNPALQENLPSTICALSEVSPLECRYFLQMYSERLNNIPFYSIESALIERYDPDISCVSVTPEGIDAAFLLSYDDETRTVFPGILAGFGKDTPRTLPYLLIFSAAAALRKYPRDTGVYLYRRDKRIANLVSAILGDMKGETVWHGIMEMDNFGMWDKRAMNKWRWIRRNK